MAGDETAGTKTVLMLRVERDAVGVFVVSAAETPGCASQGDTISAALVNFVDAFTDWCIARAVRGMTALETARVCGKSCGTFVVSVRDGMSYDPPLVEQAICRLDVNHGGACLP